MENNADRNDEYFDLDDLIQAQKLSYGARLKLLEDINEFLMNTMSAESKQVYLKLQEIGL